jgi:hypothetical protein
MSFLYERAIAFWPLETLLFLIASQAGDRRLYFDRREKDIYIRYLQEHADRGGDLSVSACLCGTGRRASNSLSI